jgi:phosphopentomutase
MINRVILIVLDSVGIGALPDADNYGDTGSNTLGHIAELYPDLSLPNLIKLGLGNIDSANQLQKTTNPMAAYGKAIEKSAGKDTTTGHWEIAGVVLEKPFPTFPNGFPNAFMDEFHSIIGSETLGNEVASGTEIINRLGDEHVRSGKPIVYTSADSVFQIAMHEDIISVEEQYAICNKARNILIDEYAVGRVIARPFIGKDSNYRRTANRKDFSLLPPNTLLDAILENGKTVFGVGKIVDIFAGKGISSYQKTGSNVEGIKATIEAMEENKGDLIFTNLVDFDMLYGHRRNVEGYAKCLMEFDQHLPSILNAMKSTDLLIITADHGNDPSYSGTDHTREYIPILNIGEKVIEGANIGTRESFADIASSIGEALSIPYKGSGKSYYTEITNLT